MLPLEEACRAGTDALDLDLEADRAELTAELILGCRDETTELTMLFWPEEKLDLAGEKLGAGAVKLDLAGEKLGAAAVKLGLASLVVAKLFWPRPEALVAGADNADCTAELMLGCKAAII